MLFDEPNDCDPAPWSRLCGEIFSHFGLNMPMSRNSFCIAYASEGVLDKNVTQHKIVN